MYFYVYLDVFRCILQGDNEPQGDRTWTQGWIIARKWAMPLRSPVVPAPVGEVDRIQAAGKRAGGQQTKAAAARVSQRGTPDFDLGIWAVLRSPSCA